jgi:hypothetical protein
MRRIMLSAETAVGKTREGDTAGVLTSVTQAAVRGQTAAIPHRVPPWRWDEGRQLLQEFQRRQLDTPGTIRPGPSESVEEITTLVLCQTLQGDRPSGGVADQALVQIAAMGGNMK